ncbi:MAG: hypothetical protein JWR77_662 [Rhizorhabdus sp.]|nr:hypothetical protein [Rhizorhabdus sp.]
MTDVHRIAWKGSIDMANFAWEAPAVLRRRGEIQPDMMFRIHDVAEGSVVDCLDMLRATPCDQRSAFAIKLKSNGCELHATEIEAMLAFVGSIRPRAWGRAG